MMNYSVAIDMVLWFYLFSFGWVLRRTNTVMIIWRLSSFTGGGRPHVPLRPLFQARAGI